MQYIVATYLISKNKVRSKVAIRFSSLDLTFLNMESEESDDESAPRCKDTAGPSSDTNPPPAA